MAQWHSIHRLTAWQTSNARLATARCMFERTKRDAMSSSAPKRAKSKRRCEMARDSAATETLWIGATVRPNESS
jgi:hypothetical protein